jgi:Na+/melibiose symporter-like transporter
VNDTPLFRLRVHFFVLYAIFGAVSPYLSVYLRDVKGLEPSQIGTAYAFALTGVLFMPALMTLLADRYGVVRPLLLGLFALQVLALGLLTQAVGFLPSLLCVCLLYLAHFPKVALSDGAFFAWQSDPTAPRVPFPKVRVWGTLGFIAGGAGVFFAFRASPTLAMPAVAIVAALLGAWNSQSLPQRPVDAGREGGARWPSLEAAQLFRRPRLALFCAGMGLIVSTNSFYYGFYPLYLTEQVAVPARWVGLVANIGVAIEVAWLLSMDRMQARFGLGGVVLLGGLACVVRQAILAFLPYAGAAVALQGLHGLTIVGVLVTPLMYLNSFARDGIRHSVQGLYAMLVAGAFGILGHYVAGQLAQSGLLTLYRTGFVVCAVGLGIVAWALRREQKETPRRGCFEHGTGQDAKTPFETRAASGIPDSRPT